MAYQGQSSSLPAKDPNRKKLAGAARQHVGPVASQPGEFQRPARMLLVALGGNKEVKSGAAKTTFADAFEQAKQSLEKMQLVEAELKAARDKGDKAAAEALQRQKRENSDAARQSLELALAVADAILCPRGHRPPTSELSGGCSGVTRAPTSTRVARSGSCVDHPPDPALAAYAPPPRLGNRHKLPLVATTMDRS